MGGLGGPAGGGLDRPPGNQIAAPRPNRPRTEACGDHTRHLPCAQICQATGMRRTVEPIPS